MYIVLILLKAFSQCSHNLAKINYSEVVTSLTMTQGYINLVSIIDTTFGLILLKAFYNVLTTFLKLIVVRLLQA